MSLRKLKKAFLIFLSVIVALILLAVVFINSPFAHRFVTGRVNSIFVNAHLPLSIHSIEKVWPNSAVIDGVYIFGIEGDTIIHAEKVRAAIKPLALLKRRVIIPSAYLSNSSVRFSRRNENEKINIADTFTKNRNRKEKNGKKSWEVSVGSARISGLKFQMSDSVAGIFIDQEVGSLNLETNLMSIIDKAILVQTLDIEGASGSIKTSPKQAGKKNGKSGTWNFGLANLSLKDINFLFDHPEQRLALNLSLEDAIVRTGKSDIKNRTFDFSKVSLSGASTLLQMDNISGESKEKSPGESGLFPWDITCKNLDLENVFFEFGDYNDGIASLSEPAFSMNRLDMKLSDIELNSHAAGLVMKRMSFDLNNGFSVTKTKGELDSKAGTTLLNLYLETGNSLVNIEGKADDNFFDLVAGPESIGAAFLSISNSQLSLKDLEYFKPGLMDQSVLQALAEKPFSIDGNISLRESVIMLSAFSISQASNFRFTVEGKINDTVQFGITDVNTLWLTEILDGFGFNKYIPGFSYLAFKGTLSDSLRSPDFTLEMKSDLGDIDLSGSFDFEQDSFKLASQFDRFKLDRILNSAELESFSGSGEIAGSGINRKAITADAVLSVDSLRFKGYDYTKGKITCNIRPSIYDVRFIVDDPAFRLDLTAGINTTDSSLAINTTGAFMAKTNNLNLLNDTLDVEGSLIANLIKVTSSLEADLTISDLALTNPREKIVASLLKTSLRSDTLLTSLSGKSGFYALDVQVEKPADSLKTIIPAYKNYIVSFLDSLTMNRTIQNSHLPGMHAKINMKYHEAFDLILKGFHFENIDLEIINSPSKEKLQMTILSRDIKYKMFELGILNTRITDSTGVINLQLAADSNKIFSHPGNRLLISGRSADWQGKTKLSIMDEMDELVYDLEISLEADSANFYVKVPSRQLTLNGVQWQMDSEELLSYNYTRKRISPTLKMHTENSSLQLFAEGNEFNHLIRCDLRNLRVGSLLPENIIRWNPGGQISGSLHYNSYGENSNEINTDLIFSDLRWSDLNFNNLTLKSKYKSEKPKVWTLDTHSLLDSAEIVLKGEKTDRGSLALHAELQKFPIKTAQPFVKEYLTDLDGFVSGDLNISSHEEIEDIDGEIIISEGNLRVNALNSAYKIPEGKIRFDGKKMLLDNFTILDSTDNKLFVNGSFDFSNPEIIYTDLDILSSDLQVMNRKKKDNSNFFGQVFINSQISVKGPLPNPDLKGKILLTGETEVFYRMKEDLSFSGRENVITFVSETPVNDQKDFSLNEKQARIRNSTVETLVEIDPHTRIHFNLTQQMYVIDIMIQGGGALNYGLLGNNQMNLSGKYDIGEGTADVKMTGWPNKQFRIASGGYISWDGNIEDPILKLEALNRVNCSYTNPVDGQIRNVDFNVILKLADRLSTLDMTFTINTPDQYLMSIINTLSPEEQMRQAITILLFERIDLPGISTSTDYVTQQVNQILASQLNELTKTAIKGVDISFGIDTYTSASSSGGEQTNTSLSYDVQKAVLNDRGKIEISGRINDYSNQQSSSNISLNNFSFEYQLDSSATKFVKVYNEHSYEDVFDGEVIKTGVGFIYRKSYPTLGDLWRRSDRKKKSKKTGK